MLIVSGLTFPQGYMTPGFMGAGIVFALLGAVFLLDTASKLRQASTPFKPWSPISKRDRASLEKAAHDACFAAPRCSGDIERLPMSARLPNSVVTACERPTGQTAANGERVFVTVGVTRTFETFTAYHYQESGIGAAEMGYIDPDTGDLNAQFHADYNALFGGEQSNDS
jgi:hypothetical protein